MLQPSDMLAVARLLATQSGPAPSDAPFRRAISTAYYAAFHTVLQMAADRFIGQGQRTSAGYALLYRGYTHTQMRRICEDIDRPTLSDRYRNVLKKNAVASTMRDFASNFVVLQTWRHSADYDPQMTVQRSDAVNACNLAELVIAAITSTPEPDRTDFLALLLVNLRA